MKRALLLSSILLAGCTPETEHSAEAVQEAEHSAEAAEEAHHPAWGYEGDHGPAAWASVSAICGSGLEQSPIDLPAAVAGEPATQVEAKRSATPLQVAHNGHTVVFQPGDNNSLEVEGRTYQLLQFHVHTPSEHTVAGASFPMEIHFVHQDEQDRLAVLGLLFSEGPSNPHLQDAVALIDGMQSGDERSSEAELDVAALIPESAVHHYDGSLTTPPCSEGVSWFVLGSAATASAEQLAAFESTIGPSNRPVQPLGDRVVGSATVEAASVEPASE